eukprot:65579-Rhodomonas_salina.1
MPSLVSSGRAGAGVVIFVAVLAATLDAALAVRSFAGGKTLNAKLSTETEVNYESFSLRLRGGHCRTTTRQTSYKIPRQTEHQKKNEAVSSSHFSCTRPCPSNLMKRVWTDHFNKTAVFRTVEDFGSGALPWP